MNRNSRETPGSFMKCTFKIIAGQGSRRTSSGEKQPTATTKSLEPRQINQALRNASNYNQVLEICEKHNHQLTADNLQMAWHRLATLSKTRQRQAILVPEELRHLRDQTSKKLPYFSPRCLAITAWSLSVLGGDYDELFEDIAETALNKSIEFHMRHWEILRVFCKSCG